jgi:hypothetical protein
MRFVTDDATLRAGVTLDAEHRDLDLRNGLGDELLDELVAGMLEAHSRAEAPDGTRWPPLRESTIHRKGHAVIGIATGKTHITDPETWTRLPRRIERRAAWLYVSRGDRRYWQIHGWQNGVLRNNCPARPLLGWTRGAQSNATDLVRDAEHSID